MPLDHKLDIGEFTLHLRSVLLPMNLTVDDVRLAGVGVHLEREPFKIAVKEAGRLEVFVSDDSLAAFLEAQSPAGLRKFRVHAKDGKLNVFAVKTVLVDLKVEAVCTLRMDEGRKLMVDLESVEVAGAGIKTLLQSQLDKINPILDLADIPVKASITSVDVGDGGVTLSGFVEPP